MSDLKIEFYWRPGCGFCSALRRPLMASGLPVQEINIWEDPNAAARVREIADGNEVVPTVVVGSWSGVYPSFAEIEAAVRKQAPELLGS